MMLAGLQTEENQVSVSAQSELAQSMVSTMGKDSAISACWANEWFGVLEEIYALDRASANTASGGKVT